MANGRNYSDETKAAVLAALLEGQSVSEIAGRYNIPEGTVHSWKSRTRNGDSLASLASEKRERIGDLLLELVETEIETLIYISKAVRNDKWITLQSASELAVFSGVKHDKLVRVLEAFGDDSNSDVPTAEN